MMKLFKDALLIGLISILFIIVLSLFSFLSVLHPQRVISTNTPKTFGLKYESLQLKTEDNVKIHAWYIPAKEMTDKAIICLHGYGADMGDILASRLFLHPKYNLLFLDFRYFGQSEGDHSTIGMHEVNDLNAAIKYLQSKHQIKDIGVWGLSMGGAVALMTAVNNKAINAIVAESSYADLDTLANNYYKLPFIRYPIGRLMRFWGYVFFGFDAASNSPMKAAGELRIPVLYLHSKSDSIVPFEHLIQIRKSASANPESDFYIYDKKRHGGLPENYQEKIGAFFAAHLTP